MLSTVALRRASCTIFFMSSIHVCYFYDGKASGDTTQVTSEKEVPKKGTTIERRGGSWHVSDVERKELHGAKRPFFIVYLNLASPQ